jgi:hypothetical protein
MRDPDLVQRAERAAIALERAWGHWRIMHGLGADPLPPVSSYVGYSLEEPWGQPRVVFGVGAEEAEKLAALLDGHDCVGPVHAEVTGRPDWRRLAEVHDELPQAAGEQSRAELLQAELLQAEPLQAEPLQAEPDTQVLAAGAGADEPGIPGQGEATRPAMSRMFPSVPLLPVAGRSHQGYAVTDPASPQAGTELDDAEITQASMLGQPGIVAFRRRGEPEASMPQELTPLPAAQDGGPALELPSQGPGYRGPRYQGFPPQYQDGPEDRMQPALAEEGASDSEPGHEELDRARPLLVSSLGRSRRPQTAGHEPGTWTPQPEHEQAATDTAV